MMLSARPPRLLGGTLLTLALAFAGAAAAAVSPNFDFLTQPPSPSQPLFAMPGLPPLALGVGTVPDAASAARLAAPGTGRTTQPASVVPTAGWSSESNVVNRKLGMGLCPAGDVDGDGISDFVAIGDVNSFHSALYLFLGSAFGPVLAPGYPVIDLPPGAQVAPAGDVNGDDHADIVLFWYANGAVRVYFGAAGGFDLVNFNSLPSFGSNLFGFNAAPAGDVNGDGFGDIIFGMPSAAGFSPCTPSANSGVAEVLYGSATGVSSTRNWYVTGCMATGASVVALTSSAHP